MYTIILWDLDNTLLNFTASEKYAFDTCMENAGITPTDELLAAYSKVNLSFWKRLERGEITKDALLTQRFPSFFEAVGISGVDTVLFQRTYQQLLGSVVYPLDNSLELCQKLHKSFRQYIVTNGVAVTQRSKLKISHLAECIDGYFISEEIGAEKPSTAFFDAVFSKIPDFKKENALLVGDSLTSDMLGANLAQIDACWYNPAGEAKNPDISIRYEIKNLWELEDIIK